MKNIKKKINSVLALRQDAFKYITFEVKNNLSNKTSTYLKYTSKNNLKFPISFNKFNSLDTLLSYSKNNKNIVLFKNSNVYYKNLSTILTHTQIFLSFRKLFYLNIIKLLILIKKSN